MVLGIVLLILSLLVYSLQIILFHDSKTTVFYFFQDTAFVPLNVFIVSVVLEQILSRREKKEKMRKINIVISAFFNEVGTSLIRLLVEYNENFHSFKKIVSINSDTTSDDFDRFIKSVGEFNFVVDSRKSDLTLLNSYMNNHKNYILGMFENPNLLEHDAFTDMLWSVFHVLDELDSRERLNSLPENDMNHISIDIERALKLLIHEMLHYMKHLKKEYPYLFSLAARKNPFSEKNQVVFE